MTRWALLTLLAAAAQSARVLAWVTGDRRMVPAFDQFRSDVRAALDLASSDVHDHEWTRCVTCPTSGPCACSGGPCPDCP